ncbi:MAG TPA: hypothetical protein VJH03_17490 [Blastocatellia bacterium]|nr:hypothetical protein [Blastocatellia bacterium]
MSSEADSDIQAFIDSLPDPHAARTFLTRLESLGVEGTQRAPRDTLLLSRLLTIAAFSPFLAETLLRHPDYINWLEQQTSRDLGRVKSKEQLSEDLARFVARLSGVDRTSSLGQFKRRELLRVYLRDCLGLATLAEITEELSNLADAILTDALAIALQEMVNRYGAPLARDERGRVTKSEFAIVALGKLGCRELNYASDIDLLFLFSGPGQTAGDGRQPGSVISNKEFFAGVAERIVRMIGGGAVEGPVYRIDLRLRPYGRDGDVVWEIERAADYYKTQAQTWEQQALIRARASAGSETVVARFIDLVRDVVFRPEALPHVLSDVRRVKDKIDRKSAGSPGGFNVKLGPGGIREIEFIAQALQLAHGGREPWVRSTQTLIVLARLAEKGLLTEAERARLSAAYTFLRTVEHRLQMDHGAQTHKLPLNTNRLKLLARRMGYDGVADPAAELLRDIAVHTSAVRAVFDRVFTEGIESEPKTQPDSAPTGEAVFGDETARLIAHAASALNRLLEPVLRARTKQRRQADSGVEALTQIIGSALTASINPLRSLRNLIAWAESLATYDSGQTPAARLLHNEGVARAVERLIVTLGSQYLSHILISRPTLADAVDEPSLGLTRDEFLTWLRPAMEGAGAGLSESDALRRAWYRLVIGIGYRDIVRAGKYAEGSEGAAELRANNLEQTALAEASLQIATGIAIEGLGVSTAPGNLPFTIMGLGRLGHAGIDYGSDLDLLVVYDDTVEWPPLDVATKQSCGAKDFPPPQEFFARLTSQIVNTLSSITREGVLYRVDLRLRPDGQSGPVAVGLASLVAYLTDRGSAWEHSAYLKAREVVGNATFGSRVRRAMREAVFDAARRNPSLKEDLAAMRTRLEKEKAGRRRLNVKWGRGGMTDVYFITRYLQLRDRIYYPPEEGTVRLIAHLGERGALNEAAAAHLFEGYSFLRRLDHWMRLLLDRPTPVMPASQVARDDLARALGLGAVEELDGQCEYQTSAIRRVYDAVFG